MEGLGVIAGRCLPQELLDHWADSSCDGIKPRVTFDPVLPFVKCPVDLGRKGLSSGCVQRSVSEHCCVNCGHEANGLFVRNAATVKAARRFKRNAIKQGLNSALPLGCYLAEHLSALLIAACGAEKGCNSWEQVVTHDA